MPVVKTIVFCVLYVLVSSAAFGTTTTYTRTHADMMRLSFALEAFRLELGRYPTQSEGLMALVIGPADVPKAKWEPYFKELQRTDAWGHDFVYRFPGIHNKGSFDLFSLGEDGVSKSGGLDADDINNWDPYRSWLDHYLSRIPRPQRLIISWTIGVLGVGSIAFVAWRTYGTPSKQ
jgi:general secretion pathway protein G